MTDTSRACKCCSAMFSASNSELEFCSTTCIDTYFKLQHEDLDVQHKNQTLASNGLRRFCLSCGNRITSLTKRHTPKLYCSSACTLRGLSRVSKDLVRPCVHCDVDVHVTRNMRPEFVRCDKHKTLWPKVQLQSMQNLKKIKVAQEPYSQYFMKGPWWDHKKKAWTVLLMHSGASSQREMEYARYLLSVKNGSRLTDSVPIVYADGDRSNVEISNLALG